MIDTILQATIAVAEAVAAGANAVSTLVQNKRNARQARLDPPIGDLLIEQARADMERRRRERDGQPKR